MKYLFLFNLIIFLTNHFGYLIENEIIIKVLMQNRLLIRFL